MHFDNNPKETGNCPDMNEELFFLFVLKLYVKVNNFSVISGQFPVFFG